MTNLKDVYEQFRKLDAERTQGVWKWSDRRKGWSNTALASLDAGDSEVCNFGDERMYYPTEGSEPCETDKLFIIYAANNALPALEQAMAEIERLRGVLKGCLPALYAMQGDTEDLQLRDAAIHAAEEALSETTE